jgi:hypothetical protein
MARAEARLLPGHDLGFGKREAAYSISSSAVAMTVCGTVRPSVLAVLRLMTGAIFC